MSYDVTVFEPSMAPADPDAYVDWTASLAEAEPLDPDMEPALGLTSLLARLMADIPGFADYADCGVVGPTLQLSFPFDHAGDVMPVLMDLVIEARFGVEVESEGIMMRETEALQAFSRLGIKAVGDIDGLIFLD